MQTMDEIITEMTYMAKKINPSVNRRISMSFRDCELKEIFEFNLQYSK